jgi:hypothetical protein
LFQQRDQGTARASAWPTCGPLWRASSATRLDAQVLIPLLSETAEGGEEQQGADRQGPCGGRVQMAATMMFLSSGHPSHIAWITGHDGDLAVGR